MFGTQYHEEIVKRCPKFLAFLSPSLTSQTLSEILINSFVHSNEKSSAVCECLTELINSVEFEILESIFGACKEIPEAKINMKFVGLIKNILIKVGNMPKSSDWMGFMNLGGSKKKKDDKLTINCISFLWRLVQDNSKVPIPVIKEIFRSLKRDLATNVFKNEREDFLLACAENLRAFRNVTQSILIIKSY